jgi:hypothetical protein
MSRFTKYEVGDRVKFLALIFSSKFQDHKGKEADVVDILKPKKCCTGGESYELEFDDGTRIHTIKKNLQKIKKKDDEDEND